MRVMRLGKGTERTRSKMSSDHLDYEKNCWMVQIYTGVCPDVHTGSQILVRSGIYVETFVRLLPIGSFFAIG
jgi:hypothetical protein